MKIRWTNSSLRLRIAPEELAQLKRGETVSAQFLWRGLDGWCVRVEVLPATSLSMSGGVLLFALSQSDVAQLAQPEREGVYFSQDGVRFYIEKDFPCAHPRASESEEAPSETFAPPAGFEERKTG